MSSNSDIEKRLQILEDREAIREAMTRYGLYFDLGRYQQWYDVWTDDAYFATDGPEQVNEMKGKEAIKARFGPTNSPGTSQHLQVNQIIDIDEDTAKVTGYQLITAHDGENPAVVRTGIRTFLFQRIEGKWQLKESISHTMKNREGCDEIVPPDL